MSSIVGVAGLEATYEAICRGKRVGLANKEVLVSAGELVMEAVQRLRGRMIPVDSEHNGAHQCLSAGRRERSAKADPDRLGWSVSDYSTTLWIGDAGSMR